MRYQQDYLELEDTILPNEKLARLNAGGGKQRLKAVYLTSRGFELGTFDASILPIICEKQSANWDVFALGYISDVVSIVHGFTQDLLHALCKNERIRQGLNDVLLNHLLDRYEEGIEYKKVMLSVERSGTPLTLNHYFSDS